MSKYGLTGFDGNGEPDFAIGSVTGVRWWNLTGTELTGVHGSWAMGENVAYCAKGGRPDDAHMVPEEDCACGFWAYWTTAASGNPHNFQLPVLGVIEGYGKTLIGEKGFRCAKARIVALHIPPAGIASRDADAPAILNRHTNAVATWRALRGDAPRKPPDAAELMARLVVREMQLEEAYGVPLYSTAAYMLERHPPTADYLPQSARTVSLPTKPTLTVAEAQAILAAKAAHSSDL